MNNGRRDAKVSRQLERFHLSKTGPLLCMPEYGLSKVRTLTQPPPCRFTYTSGARNTSQPSEKKSEVGGHTTDEKCASSAS